MEHAALTARSVVVSCFVKKATWLLRENPSVHVATKMITAARAVKAANNDLRETAGDINFENQSKVSYSRESASKIQRVTAQ
jgi:hypothetical protein